MREIAIIKVGGNIIDNETKLAAFLEDFAALPGNKILVHGGGKIATEIGDKLGIQSNYVNGRRITDKETLDVVTMVYGGLVNKKIVAQLQQLGCNAIGLTGADGNIISAVKRPVGAVDYGYVGDVTGVNVSLINTLADAGFTLVMAPLTHSEGVMLNTNADTIAQQTAKALAETARVQLVYCFEKKGVLMDADNENEVINTIDKISYEELKANNIVSGGMLPKLDNAFEAIDAGVSKVIIGQAEALAELLKGNAGTQIIK